MSQRRLLQWINALTLKRTCFLLSLWNLSDFSLYPFPIVLFVWHLWRGTLHPLWSIGSFKYWSTVIIRFPAALSSPGSEDIIDSVFQHRMGSLSFDHGPLLNPFQRAHNLWTAGTRTWHSTLCLAWLALGGMTMTLQMPPKTYLPSLLQQHKAGPRAGSVHQDHWIGSRAASYPLWSQEMLKNIGWCWNLLVIKDSLHRVME